MSKKITCTRCLGKGFIDKKDIKRLSRGLNRVSEWEENSDCKFCKGEGTITEKFASKHNPDSGEFPNIVDNSGLIDFLELTNEEKNKQYREFKEKFGDKILNPDEEENNELENNSQPKTIFWTAFVSVVLTLSVVLFFSGELNKQGESDISTFFKGLGIVLMLIFTPATIIYRLMFGKIDREDLNDFYYLFLGFIFITVLFLMDELFQIGLLRGSIITDPIGLMIIVSLISLLVTKLIDSFIFLPKKQNTD